MCYLLSTYWNSEVSLVLTLIFMESSFFSLVLYDMDGLGNPLHSMCAMHLQACEAKLSCPALDTGVVSCQCNFPGQHPGLAGLGEEAEHPHCRAEPSSTNKWAALFTAQNITEWEAKGKSQLHLHLTACPEYLLDTDGPPHPSFLYSFPQTHGLAPVPVAPRSPPGFVWVSFNGWVSGQDCKESGALGSGSAVPNFLIGKGRNYKDSIGSRSLSTLAGPIPYSTLEAFPGPPLCSNSTRI